MFNQLHFVNGKREKEKSTCSFKARTYVQFLSLLLLLSDPSIIFPPLLNFPLLGNRQSLQVHHTLSHQAGLTICCTNSVVFTFCKNEGSWPHLSIEVFSVTSYLLCVTLFHLFFVMLLPARVGSGP